jgi:hypothetical protein
VYCLVELVMYFVSNELSDLSYVSVLDAMQHMQLLVSVDSDAVFTASPHPSVLAGKIALNGLQRRR